MAPNGHTALPLRPVGLQLFHIMAGTYVQHVNITCAFTSWVCARASVRALCILNLIVSQQYSSVCPSYVSSYVFFYHEYNHEGLMKTGISWHST